MESKFLSENLCMKSQLDDIGVNAKKVLSLVLKDFGVGVNVGLMCLRIVIVGKGVVNSHVMQVININNTFKHNSVILLRYISYIASFNDMFRL